MKLVGILPQLSPRSGSSAANQRSHGNWGFCFQDCFQVKQGEPYCWKYVRCMICGRHFNLPRLNTIKACKCMLKKKTQPAATLIRGVIVQPLGGLPLNSMIFHVTSARINQNPLQLFFQSDWWGWTSSHHTIRTCEHFAGNVSEKWWQHMVGVRRFLLFWWAWLDDSWQQKIIPRAQNSKA